MEKILSTFHASNIVLQQQYREIGFQKYYELITCLLLAEQNNELLLKNHESRPTVQIHFQRQMQYNRQIRCVVVGRPRYVPNRHYNDRRPYRPQQRFNTGRNINNDEECTRCGIKDHWVHVCRTANHFAELYRALKERQGRIVVETNHASHDDTFDDVMNENITHLDADDLLDIADEVK
ncbi:uncharacterized protein LOC127240527 [Andrographis paniculata]|uniref:uncharacterized protein LOC127240527 n=1 Tax=Andrographis paniculata TaxID=175694 RepID=UPI0021E8C0CE|nr:uncharacterized protein LOC127240527 [Andrographis paniculata]